MLDQFFIYKDKGDFNEQTAKGCNGFNCNDRIILRIDTSN